MTEEEFIHETIARIQADYRKQIQPYVDRLVAIESCKPLPPVLIFDPAKLPEYLLDQLKRAE